MAVDEVGVDEMGVDEIGRRKSGTTPMNYRLRKVSSTGGKKLPILRANLRPGLMCNLLLKFVKNTMGALHVRCVKQGTLIP